MDNAFAIDGNHEPGKKKAAEYGLIEYIKENGNDPQINDTLRVLRIFDDERLNNDFEACCEMAAPIFDRLSSANEWDFYDIRILAGVVDYADTYEKANVMAKAALEKLEEYANEERYAIIKLSIHMNILLRLLRARYYDLDNISDPKAFKTLELMFELHFDAVMFVSEDGDFPMQKAAAVVRKGIFYRDNKLAGEGFSVLESLKEYEAHKMLQDEATEYEFYSGLTISRSQFNSMVGRNIRRERNTCKLSIDDIAVILDMTPAAVGLMERGDRGQTSFNLCKLAEVFGITADVFFKDTESGPTPSKLRLKKAHIHKFVAYANRLSEDEMELVTMVAKNLSELKQRNNPE